MGRLRLSSRRGSRVALLREKVHAGRHARQHQESADEKSRRCHGGEFGPGARPSRTASAVRDLAPVFVLEKVGFSLRSNLQSAEGEACDLPLCHLVIYVTGTADKARASPRSASAQ